VARCALGLLLSRFELHAIAVEGLSEEDEQGAPDAVVEIADATFYYGNGASFETCTRMEVAQFKYSVSKADTPLRMADLRPTLAKFAATEKEFVSKHGAKAAARKIKYSIYSNRPFAPEMLEAFSAASAGQKAVPAGVNAQLRQLQSAVKQSDDELMRFAARVLLVGRMDSLEAIERGNARTVADWSASNDALARARIGDLRDIVRKKAGTNGQRDKLLAQVDVLNALGLGHESELLPTPQAFPEVGNVVRRVQLSEFIATVPNAPRWIVHASGGLGKTVFVQSVAAELSQHNEVVLFDCFGGGAYRTLADGRHRPERGLLHIVNELACRGLCDPILPGTSDSAEVVRRSIYRLRQAVEVVRRTKPRANLFVIIDAADNAAMEASNRHQWSFPHELIESLTAAEPIDGLTVIVTARPERVAIAIGSADCRPFEIKPFTLAETDAFISARRTDATSTQVEVVHRYSAPVWRVHRSFAWCRREIGASRSEVCATARVNSRGRRAHVRARSLRVTTRCARVAGRPALGRPNRFHIDRHPGAVLVCVKHGAPTSNGDQLTFRVAVLDRAEAHGRNGGNHGHAC